MLNLTRLADALEIIAPAMAILAVCFPFILAVLEVI